MQAIPQLFKSANRSRQFKTTLLNFNKIEYIVKEIAKDNQDFQLVELIENSDLQFEPHWNNELFPNAFDLNIKVKPAIFTKNFLDNDRMAGLIRHYINSSSDITVDLLDIKPDYDKISILSSQISIIDTPWGEINTLQRELINGMKNANSSLDFQNIGNSSRTIMDKLARTIFNPEIHIPSIEKIDIRDGKFKNQLHTYIAEILKGAKNSELRKFAKSSIDFTESGIDLMNKTTHKLDVQKHFAEVCVISTISVVSLIKAISEKEKTA